MFSRQENVSSMTRGVKPAHFTIACVPCHFGKHNVTFQ